jgi:parvulin-like peptidyl-prolyl isomerase
LGNLPSWFPFSAQRLHVSSALFHELCRYNIDWGVGSPTIFMSMPPRGHRVHRPLVLVFALLTLLVAACSGAATNTPPPQPTTPPALPTDSAGIPLVASVNGVGIRQPLFERALVRYQQQVNAADLLALRETVLSNLVEQVLIEQAATQQNVIVSDAEVDAEYTAYVQDAGGATAFETWLTTNSYSADEFRQALRESLYTTKMRDVVTAGLNGNVPHVRARHILVASLGEAQEVLSRLQAGEDFGALALQYSTDITTREQGGDLGWFTREELLEPTLAEVAFTLDIGASAGPIQSNLGFHVIQTLEKAEMPIETEKLPLIAQTQFENWLAGLRANATIQRYI